MTRVETDGSSALRAYLAATAHPPDLAAAPASGPPAEKRYHGGPRLTLPGPGRAEVSALGVSLLGELLFATFGLGRQRFSAGAGPGHVRPRRFVPSGGALYSTEVYVAHRHVPGVGDGLSHYDATHHQLELLVDGDVGLTFGAERAPAQIVLILTAAAWKNTFRYRDFAYRLQALDVGAVAQQALEAGAALGGRAQLYVHFDAARVAAVLGLDEAAEYPLAAVTLRWPDGAPVEVPREPRATSARGTTPPGPGLEACPAAWDLQCSAAREARRRFHGPPSEWPEPLDAPLCGARPHANPSEGAAWSAPRFFGNVARRRSSPQGFSPVALRLEQVLRLTTCLTERERLMDGLAITLVARRVSGISPGAYRLVAGTDGLRRVGGAHEGALLLGGTAGGREGSELPAAWLYPHFELEPNGAEAAHAFRCALLRVGRMLQLVQVLGADGGVSSHISLAYGVRDMQRALGEGERRYPAAQIALGVARLPHRHLEVALR